MEHVDKGGDAAIITVPVMRPSFAPVRHGLPALRLAFNRGRSCEMVRVTVVMFAFV